MLLALVFEPPCPSLLHFLTTKLIRIIFISLLTFLLRQLLRKKGRKMRMKLLAALISITPIIGSTYSSVSSSIKSNEMNSKTWRNLLESSPSMTCGTDQEVLDGTMGGNLIEYHLNAVVDTDTLPVGCSFEEMQERFLCDFKNQQFSRDYENLCTEAGGMFEEFDVDLQCSGLLIFLKAAPGCVSNSCDIGEFITYNKKEFNETLPPQRTDLGCNLEITESKDESSAECVMNAKWKLYALVLPIIVNLWF